MTSSKTGDLAKNTAVLAIGNFSSKVLTFLLVPLYTAVLSTEDYGSYDMVSSTCSLLLPVLTLNIADAVLRFPLDEEADKPGILRVGVTFSALSVLPVLAAQVLPNMPWSGLRGITFLAVYYASNAASHLMLLYGRGCDRLFDVAVAGVVGTVVTVALNVWLLVFMRSGLTGYFIASITSNVMVALYLVVRLRDVVFAPTTENLPHLARQMVTYALPLALTTIGWWFINVSDRYVVTLLCGVAENGLYSVAYKIPTILYVIQQIFIQAWQVSAVKEFDPDDTDGFIRNTYTTVEGAMVVLCALLIATTPLVARILFSGDFYIAWRYVPLLLVYIVLNTSSGLFGALFLAEKETKPITISVVLGGIANILFGFLLVPLIGVQGAAVSSLIAGTLNWAYRGWKMRGFMRVGFHMHRSLAVYMMLAVQGVLLVAVHDTWLCIATQCVFLMLVLLVYRRELSQVRALLAQRKN